ncbi:MAG: hypothetical protein IH961_02370 [Chloroflexi bacterium]|nr:hypothetical protein [Chloroflexota bacterium]
MALVPRDSHEAGQLLAWHGRFAGLRGEYEDAEEAFDSAAAIAQRDGDQQLALRTAINSSDVDAFALRYGKEALEKSARHIGLAREAGYKFAEAQAEQVIAWQALHIGELDAARDHAERLLQLAEELRFRLFTRENLTISSAIALASGDFNEAAVLSERGHGMSGGKYQFLAFMAEAASSTGEQELASQRLDDFRGFIADRSPEREGQRERSTGFLARVLAARQRLSPSPEEAEEVKRLVNGLEQRELMPSEAAVGINMGMTMLAAEEGDTTALPDLLEAMRPYKAFYIPPYAYVGRVMGLAASHLHMYDEAEDLFAESVDFCRSAGYRPELAWSLSDFSEMLLDRNSEQDRTHAESLQDECLDITRQLGMKPLMERVLRRRKILTA